MICPSFNKRIDVTKKKIRRYKKLTNKKNTKFCIHTITKNTRYIRVNMSTVKYIVLGVGMRINRSTGLILNPSNSNF